MLGRLEEAVEVYGEVLAIRQELHGPLHTDVAKSLVALATARRDLGQWQGAEALAQQALEIQERIEGLDHPQVARTRRTLGTILQAAGRLEAAAAEYERVLDVQRRMLGEDDPEFLITQTRQASLFAIQGEHVACERLARQVIEVFQATGKGSSWRVTDVESILGACLAEQGRVSEARPLLRGSYERLRKARGEHSLPTRAAAQRLATFTNSGSPG